MQHTEIRCCVAQCISCPQADGQHLGNILEPIKSKCEKLVNLNEGLCIIPALTFDEQGYRLGFGKGYYDRFLSRFKGDTAGICYECCISNRLPRGRFDRCADVVVTEKRVISNG